MIISLNITRLIGDSPNTYTYTKTLAEQVLDAEKGHVPLVIVRPSIVCAAEKEPFPGWIDSINGPTGQCTLSFIVSDVYFKKEINCYLIITGVLAGGGPGFIRIFKCADLNHIIDFIPVDYAINMIIAAAWERSINR